MSDNKWNWEDFFLFMWLMKLWDWTFGSGGKCRRAARKSKRNSRRASRRSRRTYSGDRSGLSATDNFICNLICFFYLAPLAALFVASRQKHYQKQAERKARNSTATARMKDAAPSSAVSGQGYATQANTSNRQRVRNYTDYQHMTEAELHGMTEEQLAEKKRQIARSSAPTEAQRMQDVRRVAEQQREEANRKIARAVAQQEAAKEKENARQSAFAGYSLPLTERYTDDAGMLDMSFKIEQADGDRGTFLGLFEVSYLMTDANAVTIPVAVKDDNIVKSLAIGNLPEEIRQPLLDYLTADGRVQGYTKRTWIDEELHTMKAALYLN